MTDSQMSTSDCDTDSPTVPQATYARVNKCRVTLCLPYVGLVRLPPALAAQSTVLSDLQHDACSRGAGDEPESVLFDALDEFQVLSWLLFHCRVAPGQALVVSAGGFVTVHLRPDMYLADGDICFDITPDACWRCRGADVQQGVPAPPNLIAVAEVRLPPWGCLLQPDALQRAVL